MTDKTIDEIRETIRIIRHRLDSGMVAEQSPGGRLPCAMAEALLAEVDRLHAAAGRDDDYTEACLHAARFVPGAEAVLHAPARKDGDLVRFLARRYLDMISECVEMRMNEAPPVYIVRPYVGPTIGTPIRDVTSDPRDSSAIVVPDVERTR